MIKRPRRVGHVVNKAVASRLKVAHVGEDSSLEPNQLVIAVWRIKVAMHGLKGFLEPTGHAQRPNLFNSNLEAEFGVVVELLKPFRGLRQALPVSLFLVSSN